MKDILVGSLLSAVALMILGFVFWATPVSSPGFGSNLDMEAVRIALRDAATESGTYVIPDQYSLDKEAFEAAHNAGPLGIMHINLDGRPPMQPTVFIIGFIHNFVTAMILAILLQMAIPALPSYTGRVMFCMFVGVFASVWENFTAPIWFNTPWSFYVVRTIYTVIAMTMVGAILARFIKE